ncbi:Druantia anti-phage system protein DruA [Tengunoibacter tsumagoiensis]|nr:Druantia anti-phage system protein DruA [Tengunoibacter tsumagoiensis]
MPILIESPCKYSLNIYQMGMQKEADHLAEAILHEMEYFQSFVLEESKKGYQAFYEEMRLSNLKNHQCWIKKHWSKHQHIFAYPNELQPARIEPYLELVQNQHQSNIFRLARLTWNLPYSSGYGRRLRYLVWDRSNQKLMGILGLQSPPLRLPNRDSAYRIPYEQKIDLVNQTMDAYTLGALPPYTDLLAGKLLVLAAASQDVRRDYEQKYNGRLTTMRKATIDSSLIAITTLSAYGRSSLYNRVSQGFEDGKNIWATTSLGPCEGWGTSHFSNELYQEIKKFYKLLYPQKSVSGFGTGPKVRLQIIAAILHDLGLPKDFMRHDIPREVFIIPHISNLEKVLAGCGDAPIYNDQSFEALAQFWKERYAFPRSQLRCSLQGNSTLFRDVAM